MAWLLQIVVIVLVGLGHAPISTANAQDAGTQELRDQQNRLVGKLITRSDGRSEARSRDGRYLGLYDPKTNATYDRKNTFVGRGDFLSALIDRARTDEQSQNKTFDEEQPQNRGSEAQPSGRPEGWTDSDEAHNERINRLNRPRQEGDPTYRPKYPHSVEPNPAPGEIPVVTRQTAARWGRMGGNVTQEDRYFAIDALQAAAVRHGRPVSWRNPDTGNTGAYLVTDDQLEQYVHGHSVECWWAFMTLRAGGEVDQQKQGVCKREDTGVWAVVVVDVDWPARY